MFLLLCIQCCLVRLHRRPLRVLRLRSLAFLNGGNRLFRGRSSQSGQLRDHSFVHLLAPFNKGNSGPWLSVAITGDVVHRNRLQLLAWSAPANDGCGHDIRTARSRRSRRRCAGSGRCQGCASRPTGLASVHAAHGRPKCARPARRINGTAGRKGKWPRGRTRRVLLDASMHMQDNSAINGPAGHCMRMDRSTTSIDHVCQACAPRTRGTLDPGRARYARAKGHVRAGRPHAHVPARSSSARPGIFFCALKIARRAEMANSTKDGRAARPPEHALSHRPGRSPYEHPPASTCAPIARAHRSQLFA